MDNSEFKIDFSEDYLSKKEAKATNKIVRDFMESYAANNKEPVEEWLTQELGKHLPDRSQKEIRNMSREIVSSLETTEAKKQDLHKAMKTGRSKEHWLTSSLQQSTSHMAEQDTVAYLQDLDNGITQANREMYNTITTQAGTVNQNPHLDGFIAEQAQVNSFNMNAAAKGSDFRAEVLKPTEGQAYGKNSVDVVIKDGAGKIVHRYQMKYGATADITIQMIKNGNYNSQVLIVPAEQVEAVQAAFPTKTVRSTIEAGNITSSPLTKAEIKAAQEKAQQSGSLDVDWSQYSSKDIAIGIGKNVGKASLQGAIIGAGMNLVSKAWNDEPIDGAEVVETAVTTGADFGVKAAVAGGLKTASEKGILSAIPKGTPAGTFANIAFVAVENAKVLGKVATGKLTVREGLDAMGQTTASCVAGLAVGAATGAKVGAIAGTVLGPVGTVVGGFVGSAVGYMAGSKLGETIAKGAQKLGRTAVEVAKKTWDTVKTGVSNVVTGVKSFFENLFS